MDPGAPLFQSIAVSRHADYLDEARHQELLTLARAGKPRRWPRLTMHHVIGAILAVLGQRMAGQAAMPTASMPGRRRWPVRLKQDWGCASNGTIPRISNSLLDETTQRLGGHMNGHVPETVNQR